VPFALKPPSTPQHKVDHDDNNENLVANVGSEDSYNSRKQQNNNGAQNENCGFHVEPPSFDQRLKDLGVSRQPFSASSITCRSTGNGLVLDDADRAAGNAYPPVSMDPRPGKARE
jgi:hypothetical protein